MNKEENKISKNITSQLMSDFINKNVIPVSLVEEKIEELNKGLNKDGETYGGCVINPEKIMKLENQIDVLQELLENNDIREKENVNFN